MASLLAGLGICVPTIAAAIVRQVPALYPTINAALDASSAGDTVLVAPGTYTVAETRGTPPFEITSLAFLVDGVALVSEAGPRVTILDLSQDVIVGAGIVVVGAQLTQPVTVDGFTLTGTPPATAQGRGMDLSTCQQMTVKSCVFQGTDAALSPYRCTITVLNCEFYDCDAVGGGAIASTNSSVTVIGGIVQGCEGPFFVSTQSSTPVYTVAIQDCTFKGNTSTNSAGSIQVVGSGYSSVTIDGCRFEDSQSMFGGGAIALNPDHFTTVTVTDNTFVRCQGNGPSGSVGGAVLLLDGLSLVERNTFHQCSVSDSDGSAGAAMAIATLLTTTLRNNVFTESLGSPVVEAFGGAVVSTCNVFWDNASGDVTGFSLSSSDRVIDPLYCDPDNDNLTVSRDSPCLPAHSLGCGQIGAFGEGCGPVSLRPLSWGAIKEGYR
ncbi:MAG: right-handed parallel beta-helix repeat-containing protein [Candidatus Eiseniibacteriota bacterium]